ncbi:MAG: energy-coupling factor ABC transporter permease, partial [Rhizobiaceae bacterium]
MAHIPDGVLSLPVLAVGWTVTVAGVGYGLRRIADEEIPRVALFASAFFVVSLFAIPVGPTSIHLLLGGLMGIVLGPAIFPAALIALLLQAALFGFGGLTALGFN